MVERHPSKLDVTGSNPVFRSEPSGSYSSIAQSVEQLTVNQPVPGSSPGGGARANNSVVEFLVYTEAVGGSNPSSPISQGDL